MPCAKVPTPKNPLDRLGTAIVAPPPRDDSPGQAALADFSHARFIGPIGPKGPIYRRKRGRSASFALCNKFLVHQLMPTADALGLQKDISHPDKSAENQS